MFGKPKTAEDILKAIAALSEEEQEKIKAALNGSEEEENDVKNEQLSPENEENLESEEPVQDVTDEAEVSAENEVAEEQGQEESIEEVENPEPEQVSEEPVQEAVEEDNEDVKQALISRIEALEKTISEMQQNQAEAVAQESDQDFGMNPSAPQASEEDNSRMSAVMRGYAGRNANNYI